MATVTPIKPPQTNDPKEIEKFFREAAKRYTYLEYAGNPNSNILPRWVGDVCLDTSSNEWYKSASLLITGWEKTSFSGSHGDLSDLSDDDHTQYLKEKASGGVAAEVPTHTHADAANAGTIDHGAITGLTDDDHTQYLKEKGSGGLAAEVPTHTHADAANAGTVDHGALTGLTDDDHTIYIKHALVTAANDFLVASGSGVVVKKTLAETKTILSLTVFVERADPAAYDYTVASFTTDGTWRDLDLSAIVPAGAVAALIKTQLKDDAAGSYFQYRKNGDSNAISTKTARTQVADVTIESEYIVWLDANRVAEYRGSNTTFTDINVVVCGWVI